MKIEIDENALIIKPEDAADRAFIIHVLGLVADGSKCVAVRYDAAPGFSRENNLDHVRVQKEGDD